MLIVPYDGPEKKSRRGIAAEPDTSIGYVEWEGLWQERPFKTTSSVATLRRTAKAVVEVYGGRRSWADR